MPQELKLDPKRRSKNYRSRVFVGGSYHQEERDRLEIIKAAVTTTGFQPVIADEFQLENEEDIHHETMVLLHSCRLAIFELSRPSGAFMEIERVADYGIQTLILFNAPKPTEYTGSRMLSAFVREHKYSIQFSSYLQSISAQEIVVDWLTQKKTEGFG